MSCPSGFFLLAAKCFSSCLGGVTGGSFWPNVHDYTCDPLTNTNVENLDRITFGTFITELIFAGLFIPLVALKQGSQMWLLWDSLQTLYLYSFLNPKNLPYELFWVMDAFSFSMLSPVPNLPYKLLEHTVTPTVTVTPLPSMSMFVLKNTSVYFIYSAGAAAFILCAWVVLCYFILFPIEMSFKLCKCKSVLAIFSWFNRNCRTNLLLRLLLQFSPIFVLYGSFQLFFTQFDDKFFLANYIIGVIFLLVSWLGVVACICFLHSASSKTDPVQDGKTKGNFNAGNAALQRNGKQQGVSLQPASTLIDGFRLLKKFSKYFYLYSFLLKFLLAILVVALYQEEYAIPQLSVNVFLGTVMLLYEIFFFRMDNVGYYIFQILARVALWGLSILLLVIHFIPNYPNLFNIIGLSLVFTVLGAHALAIVYAIIVGLLKLCEKTPSSNEREMVGVELTVETGAKRRRVLGTTVVKIDPNRENERFPEETTDNTTTVVVIDQDPLRSKRQKRDVDLLPNEYNEEVAEEIKHQRIRNAQRVNAVTMGVQEYANSIGSAGNKFEDLTVEYLNQYEGRPGNVSPNNTKRTSFIELDSK